MIVRVAWWTGAGARRLRAAQCAAAADVIDLFVVAVGAGLLPAQALAEVTPYLPPPLVQPFALVRSNIETGTRFVDAIADLVDVGQPFVGFVDALTLAERYGLPLGPVLDRLSFEAHHQRRLTAEASARQLPVRLAGPLVLCSLTSFVLLAIVPLLVGALSSMR